MEQYQSRGNLGPWTDAYALCATIYYCLTGQIPVEALTRLVEGDAINWDSIPGLAENQRTALKKGMSIKPEERYPDLKALEEALFGENTGSMPEPENTEPEEKEPEVPELPSQEIPVTRPMPGDRKETGPEPQKEASSGEEASEESTREDPPAEPEKKKKPGKMPKWLLPGIAAVVAAVALIAGGLWLFRYSQEQAALKANYQKAMTHLANGAYMEAYRGFSELGDYKNSAEMAAETRARLMQRQPLSAGSYNTVGLKADGTVVYVGNGDLSNVSHWSDIVAVFAGSHHVVGLKADGTLADAGGSYNGQSEVSGWTDIIAVAIGDSHTVGLKADGTVVAAGSNYNGQCNVSRWTDIVAVAAGNYHTVGLKADGTVVYVGNDDRLWRTSKWSGIVAVATGDYCTVGVKADGTVEETASTSYSRSDISGWTDIVAVAVGYQHAVGLKADGTVVAAGSNYNGQCEVSGWTDIVAVAAGNCHTVGLKSDGTVVSTEIRKTYDDFGQDNVSGWSGLLVPETASPPETTEPENTMRPDQWKENVLMADVVTEESDALRVFGSQYGRETVLSITFLDTLKDAPADAWDVSEAGDGRVLAWAEPNGGFFDLYIAGAGGIRAPSVCADLFYGYTNTKEINFNGCFYVTSDVTNMCRMFKNCSGLTALDVSGFDTSNVTYMLEMFCQCPAEIDLGEWETQNVVRTWHAGIGYMGYENFMDDGRHYNGKPWRNLFK